MNLPTKKHLSATVYYLLTALVVSWPALMATGLLLADWRSGRTLTPLSLAVIYLLVLGFMLTVALGVLYQIVPIAFQAPPVGRHVLYWHLPLHLASVITLSVGFLARQFPVVGLGGFGLVCSTAALFFFVLHSYVRARNKTPVYKGLVWPFASLWPVLLIGLGQAWFPARTGIREVVTHVLAGAFGFWSGLVLVLTYKLLPMFAISHGYKASLPRTLSLYLAGIAAWIADVWLEPSGFRVFMGAVGAILVWVGLGSFAVDMVAILKARKRRRFVLPVYHALAATGCFVVGHGWLVAVFLQRDLRGLYPAAYLFWFGGLIPLIFAYMQKMVPFLWFEYRFSKRPERKTAPLIDEMVPKKAAQTAFLLYYLGVLSGLVSLVFEPSLASPERVWTVVHWGSAGLLTAGSILLFGALRHVLTIGGPRPADN